MRTKLKIVCTLTFLSFVGNVMAQAAPSAVGGIAATANGSEITTTWNSVTSDPIAYYRVYYSEISILENAGLFDDFETTEGNETTLTFTAPLGVDTLYVTAIAVAESGLESEFFMAETQVEVGTEPTPTAPTPVQDENPSTPPPTPPVADQPESTGDVRLLKTEVVSPTEIVTTFSAMVTVDQTNAPKGLKIEGPRGDKLQIKSITIDQNTITILTEPQTRGTVYNVQFSEPFEGKNGSPLDASDRSALITGHSDGVEPPDIAPVRAVDPLSPPDITDFALVPQIQQNGAYTVTMEWAVDNAPGDLHGIVVYQTRDGQTFGPPSLLPIDIGGVQLQDVTPGFFGLYIQTINVYGYVSPGVFQYASLPQYIPGYGFYGDLTFGSMDANGNALFDEIDESEVKVPENIATIEVITKDTPLQEIKGVDHLAAAEEVARLHWKNVAVLAGGSSVVVLMLVSAFVFVPRRRGGSDIE